MDFSVIGTIYYAVFIILFLIFLCRNSIQFDNRGVRQIFSGIVIVLLTLFSGLRWETGTDWDNYYWFFNNINFSNLNNPIFYHFDLGYKVFNAAIRLFTSSYTVFLIIDTFIAVYLIYVSLKKMEVNPFLGLAIFYANYYIANYMGSNRRIIAIGCAVLAIVYFLLEEKKKAIICLTIGFLFHWTAIFAVVSIFVPKKIFRFPKMAFALAVSFAVGASGIVVGVMTKMLSVMSLVGMRQLAAVGQFYLSENIEDLGSGHFGLAVIKRVFVLLFLYYAYYYMVRERSLKLQYFLNLYTLSVCIYMILNGMGVFQMFSVYFAIMEIFVWTEIYKYAGKNNRLILTLMIFLLYTIEITASFPSYKELYLPYNWIF